MNEYSELSTNGKQEHICKFTNGFVIKTKNIYLIRKLVQGKMTFQELIENHPDCIIKPDKRELQAIEHSQQISEVIEKGFGQDSILEQDLEQNSALNKNVAVKEVLE